MGVQRHVIALHIRSMPRSTPRSMPSESVLNNSSVSPPPKVARGHMCSTTSVCEQKHSSREDNAHQFKGWEQILLQDYTARACTKSYYQILHYFMI